MKYLFVSSDKFPPFRVDVSILFGKEMTGRGHKIDFLLQSDTACYRSHIKYWSNCRVFVGAKNAGNSSFAKLIKHILSVFNDARMFFLLKRFKYDFFIVKDKFIAGFIASIISKISGIPFIYWLSFPFPEANLHKATLPSSRFPLFFKIRGKLFKFLLYDVIIPSSTHVFVQSEQMKRDIIAEGIEDQKMTPIPMGIQDELIELPLPKQINNNMAPQIVYLGTLTSTRRMDFVIRAFKQVIEKFPSTKLFMVGSSEDEQDVEALKKLAMNLNIYSSVVFTGFIPRKAALSIVQNSDVCLSPFFPTPILNSTSPTKIIEYLAMNKPVVANDHPEQRQILSDSLAGICVPYDEKAFADAICYLITNSEEAKKMGNLGRRYVQNNRSYSIIGHNLDIKLKKLMNPKSSINH